MNMCTHLYIYACVQAYAYINMYILLFNTTRWIINRNGKGHQLYMYLLLSI